jgi:adhesin transport system membrane fusion protein
VPTAFSRSTRALAVDGFGPSLGGLLLATALLGCWTAWFFVSRVAIYEVTQTARLEVDRAVHPVETTVAGRVIMTRLVLGQEVPAGEVLIELDADPEVYWTMRPAPPGPYGDACLLMHGAVLVRVRGRRQPY